LRQGQPIVENAFWNLKATLHEFFVKIDMNDLFLPRTITCSFVLHNLLLGLSNNAIEKFQHVLESLNTNINLLMTIIER